MFAMKSHCDEITQAEMRAEMEKIKAAGDTAAGAEGDAGAGRAHITHHLSIQNRPFNRM